MTKRRNRFRFKMLVAVLLGFSLIAAACSSGNSSGGTAAPSTTAGVARPIVVSLSTNVNILEEDLFRSTGSYAVTRALYQPLLDQTYKETGGLRVGTNDLVKSPILDSYNIAADGTATFVIKKGAAFANGDPITAQDAVYMLTRSIEAPDSYIPLLMPFVAIDSSSQFKVIDDQTFTITPKQPTALFGRFMTFQVFGPIDESVAKAKATPDDPWAFKYFTTHADASGPYTLTNWDQATGKVILDPNPGWPGKVANSGIIVQNVPDASQRAELLKSGDIDVAAGLPPRLLDQLKSDSDVKVYTAPSTKVNYIGMNATVEPKFGNKLVRQAISYAIPYKVLLKNVMFGLASPAGTLVTSNMETYQGKAAGVYSQDMAKAKKLMQESGVGPFQVELAVQNSQAQDQQAAVFIQDALKEIGITVKINVLPDADYSAKRGNRELPMFFHEWYSWGNDPFYQMTFLAKCKAFTNFADGCNQRLDKIITEGTFETDSAKRAALSLEAQKIMVDEANRIYLWSADWNLATRANITGVTKDYTEVPRFETLARG